MPIIKFKHSLLQLLAFALVIILILDIQNNSFDTPVIILHYLHILLGYTSSLKISNNVFDLLVLQQIIKILNLYLINLGAVVLFYLVINILIKISYLISQLKNVLPLLTSLPKLTFLKFQITNLRAFIRIP